MRITKDFRKFLAEITLGVFLVTSLNPVPAFAGTKSNDEIIYPLKEISKLDCRYTDFDDLNSSCKQKLPVLNTKDYKKYATKNGGYNDFTRLYTVLWGSSYKYGWDVGNGGHMGVDIATSKGTPVYSMADGTVIVAKELVSLGKSVSVEHKINGKTVVSSYSHLSKINVKLGDKVSVGKKVGEVGSTGNSTGNHVHFQIDLKNSFYPAYYDYKSCPYSYYEISENGVCFDQLKKITVDPLLFLETSGAVLSSIKTTTVSRDNFEDDVDNDDDGLDTNIFNKTVYIGYSSSDTKEVQKLFTLLGYYNGTINGDYDDVIDDIIDYQIDTKVVANKNADGAGRFGPKTRTQAKKDYYALDDKTIKNNTKVLISNNDTTEIETQVISRKSLLTREEIEAMEVEEFLNEYDVNLKLINPGGNIKMGQREILKLEILNKKGRPFRGNMPGGMTFMVDETKVSVFPQKLYYFTDGKRDIILTGLKVGNSNLYIKIGNQTIKTIPLKVYGSLKEVKPETGLILGIGKIVLGETKTAIAVFRDENRKNLINISYNANLKLQTSDDMKICVKSGSIKNISNIYKTKCNDTDFIDYKNFTYNDTVGGLLIFDYKAIGENANLELINNNTKKLMNTKKLVVSNPKGLSSNYEYKDEVVELLKDGVVDGINNGYFLEDRELKEYDALSWVRNTLINMNDDPAYYNQKTQIEDNLRNVFKKRETSNKYTTITRKDLLDLAYTYLVFDKSSNNGISIEYKDLEDDENLNANKIFDKNTTWKDKFGDNYFRPDEKVTRGEGAYLISKVMEKNKQLFLTKK